MRHYLKLRSYHAQSPLFLLADGMVLTHFKFVTSLQCLLTKVGLQAELYAGYSFRIGAAMTAAAAGLQDWLIQAMGRCRYIATTFTQVDTMACYPLTELGGHIIHQSACRLATVVCYSLNLVGKATDHTLPAARPLL